MGARPSEKLLRIGLGDLRSMDVPKDAFRKQPDRHVTKLDDAAPAMVRLTNSQRRRFLDGKDKNKSCFGRLNFEVVKTGKR